MRVGVHPPRRPRHRFQQESVSAGTVVNDHIMIWSDVECEAVVTATFPGLVRWFNNESKGMYKADICRCVDVADPIVYSSLILI